MTFRIIVSYQGNRIGKPLYADGNTALEAINTVESRLGLNAPQVSIDKATGKMVVVGFHGYHFSARQISE